MSGRLEQILQEALKLDGRDRARLAADLIATLDGDPDADVEEAWAVEIARRLAEVEAGEVELIPWEEARKRIEDRLRRR